MATECVGTAASAVRRPKKDCVAPDAFVRGLRAKRAIRQRVILSGRSGSRRQWHAPIRCAHGRGADEGVRPYTKPGDPGAPFQMAASGGNKSYRRAATIGALGVSVPVGIVVTRAEPFAPAGAAAGAAINPSAFRTSVSSLAMTSLLSFRN